MYATKYLVYLALFSLALVRCDWTDINQACDELGKNPMERTFNIYELQTGGESVTKSKTPFKKIEIEWDIDEAVETGVKLGAGSFGVVKEATMPYMGGQIVAIKKVKKDTVELNEMWVMNLLGLHDAGPRFYGCQYTNEHVYIVQQKLARDLESDVFLNFMRTLDTIEAMEMYYRMFDLIRIMWDLGYTHNDIKPANMMVSDEGKIYLIDLGMAQKRDTPEVPYGSPIFMSPYKFLLNGNTNIFDDIYATALTIAILEAEQGMDAIFIDYSYTGDPDTPMKLPNECFKNYMTPKCRSQPLLSDKQLLAIEVEDLRKADDDCFSSARKELCRLVKTQNVKYIMNGAGFGEYLKADPKYDETDKVGTMNFATLITMIIRAKDTDWFTHDKILKIIRRIINTQTEKKFASEKKEYASKGKSFALSDSQARSQSHFSQSLSVMKSAVKSTNGNDKTQLLGNDSIVNEPVFLVHSMKKDSMGRSVEIDLLPSVQSHITEDPYLRQGIKDEYLSGTGGGVDSFKGSSIVKQGASAYGFSGKESLNGFKSVSFGGSSQVRLESIKSMSTVGSAKFEVGPSDSGFKMSGSTTGSKLSSSQTGSQLQGSQTGSYKQSTGSINSSTKSSSKYTI